MSILSLLPTLASVGLVVAISRTLQILAEQLTSKVKLRDYFDIKYRKVLFLGDRLLGRAKPEGKATAPQENLAELVATLERELASLEAEAMRHREALKQRRMELRRRIDPEIAENKDAVSAKPPDTDHRFSA